MVFFFFTFVDTEMILEGQDSVTKLRISGEEFSQVILTRQTESADPLDAWKSHDWLHRNQKLWDINLPQESFILKTEETPVKRESLDCDNFEANVKFNKHSKNKQHSDDGENRNAVILHTDVQHPKSSPVTYSYKCYQCGKAFNRGSSLIRHQIIHTGEKPYKCSECGKLFNRRTNLTKHQNIHTEAKVYEGNKYESVFRKSEDSYKNTKVYPGDNSYECGICGKSFNRSSSLIRHQIIHTGEKPFKCKECKKTFNRKSNLMKHQKIHTREIQ